MEGRGRISRLGLTQDSKMGSCVSQCDIPHQWIAQWQVGPVFVYCDRNGLSCPVFAAWHSCVAAHWSKYHCYKQALSWYDLRCLKATLNPKSKQNNNSMITVVIKHADKQDLKTNDLLIVSCKQINLWLCMFIWKWIEPMIVKGFI